jgi:ABC-2 type transport system permease protein
VLIFWHGAFEKTKYIGDWNNQQMFTYYIFVVANSIFISHVENSVAYLEIQQGQLNSYLLKPISYYYNHFVSELPWRFIQGFYGIMMILILAAFGVPFAVTNHFDTIGLAILIGTLAFTICFFYKLFLGFLAFFITDIHGIQEVNDVVFAFCTGSLMPVDLFPQHVKNILDFTPFPYILYYPLTAFLGKYTTPQLFNIIIMQLFWIALLYIGCRLMWRSGIKRYSGIGI